MRLATCAAVCALMAAGSAAAVNTEQFTFTQTSMTLSYNDNFMLPSFNTNLGTLTGISIQVDANTSATVNVNNTDGVAEQIWNTYASVPITVTGPASFTESTTATTPQIGGATQATAVTVNPGITHFTGQTGTATNSVAVSSSNFSSFESVGGVNLNFTWTGNSASVQGSTNSSDGGVFFSGGGTAGGDVIVTYAYNAIAAPEPRSWALMIGGIGAVGALLRRQRARRGVLAA